MPQQMGASRYRRAAPIVITRAFLSSERLGTAPKNHCAVLRVFNKSSGDKVGPFLRRNTGEPNQHNTRLGQALTENKLAKVLWSSIPGSS
jgi:hypothetical protein